MEKQLLQFKAFFGCIASSATPVTCPWLDIGQITITQTRMTILTMDQLRVALTLDPSMVVVK